MPVNKPAAVLVTCPTPLEWAGPMSAIAGLYEMKDGEMGGFANHRPVAWRIGAAFMAPFIGTFMAKVWRVSGICRTFPVASCKRPPGVLNRIEIK